MSRRPHNNSGRNRKAQQDFEDLPFHFLLRGTLTSGAAQILLAPTTFISPRANAEADVWAHFKFLEFKYRLHCNVQNLTTTMQLAGFVPGVQDTNPSTLEECSALLNCCMLGQGQTLPSEWVRISREDLAGPLPWYKTIPGSADATEEAPGVISVNGGTSDPYRIEFRGVIRFKAAVAAGNTPLSQKAHQILREERQRLADETDRKKVVKLLSLISPKAPITTSSLPP